MGVANVRVIALSGLDPTGAAGLAADLRALEACGVRGCPIATAWTVQDSRRVRAVHPVPVAVVRDAWTTVVDDGPPAAVKVGLLPTAELSAAIAEFVSGLGVPVVVDPVLRATSGGRLTDPSVLDAWPRAACGDLLWTPNARELSEVTGAPVADLAGAIRAAERWRERYGGAVFAKGGHLTHGRGTDVRVAADGSVERWAPVPEGPERRGTGCALASAVAAARALGFGEREAVDRARRSLSGWRHEPGVLAS